MTNLIREIVHDLKTYDLVLIPGCQTTHHGKLVMKDPIGLACAQKWPTLPAALGELIVPFTARNWMYSLLISPEWPQSKLGLLQVCDDWREKMDEVLFEGALLNLQGFIDQHPGIRVKVWLNDDPAPYLLAPIEGAEIVVWKGDHCELVHVVDALEA